MRISFSRGSWETQGNLPRALAATRRRAGTHTVLAAFPVEFLREEGRLAALAGDMAGAVRAYRHYPMFRYDPSRRSNLKSSA